MTLGAQILSNLNKSLGIDPEWSVHSDLRIEWWPSTYRQILAAEMPMDDAGLKLTPVACRTEILESMPESPRLYETLSKVNSLTSLASLVYDPIAKTVTCRSRALVHDGTPWLTPIIQAAAAIQLHQAAQLGSFWEEQLGGRFAQSAHPSAGRRNRPDDIVKVVEAVFAPAGEAASPFAGLMDIVDEIRHPGIAVERTKDRLVVEVPFLGRSALVVVAADEKHPYLGRGLALTLQLPMPVNAAGNFAQVANELNQLETTGAMSVQSLGSWNAEGALQYQMFLPGLLGQSYDRSGRAQLAHTLMLYLVHRSVQVHRLFETPATVAPGPPPGPSARTRAPAGDMRPHEQAPPPVRAHHYYFGHVLLPRALFSDPGFLLNVGRDQRLVSLWEKAGREVPGLVSRAGSGGTIHLDPAILPATGLKCTLEDVGPVTAAIVDMPAAAGPAEIIHSLTLVSPPRRGLLGQRQDSPRYFVLEWAQPLMSIPSTMWAEWTPSGRQPLGNGPPRFDVGGVELVLGMLQLAAQGNQAEAHKPWTEQWLPAFLHVFQRDLGQRPDLDRLKNPAILKGLVRGTFLQMVRQYIARS